MANRPSVKRGQVYRAKARRGYRYVRIDQIRGLASGQPPYALATEVLESGVQARGWLHGVRRDQPIRIALRWVDGRAAMPERYELAEVAAASFAERSKDDETDPAEDPA